jgi:hypothetical protein
MTLIRIPARLAALAIGVALLMSCDTRGGTGIGGGGGGVVVTGMSVKIQTPLATDMLNTTDSLLQVQVKLHDDVGLQNVVVTAFSVGGSAVLGTQVIKQRYNPVLAPPSGSFTPGAGQYDTTVTRFLRVLTPIDTTTRDTLYIIATARNTANKILADTVKVRLVNGPSVVFLAPTSTDSAYAGGLLQVQLLAKSDIGIDSIGFRAQSNTLGANLDVRYGQPVTGRPSQFTFAQSVPIPANAKPGDVITLTPISRDANRQPGSSTQLRVVVGGGAPPAPLVYQTIDSRVEVTDSVTIRVVGYGISQVGFEVVDSSGVTVVATGTLAVTSATPAPYQLPLNLPLSLRGQRLTITSYAVDQNARTGYSLPAGVTTSQPTKSLAYASPFLVVYGQTYSLPPARIGTTIADLIVDQPRGNVFLSNIQAGRLEVWKQATRTFDPNGIAVGAQPWGMALSRTAPLGDTMYVANSGGTNLSRVYIGTTGPMQEDLARRMLTRISLLYKVTETRDKVTSKITIAVNGPILFSDRPQYVQQSVSGRIYLSTKPTPASGEVGTVRYMDPGAVAPDQRFLLAFASRGSSPSSFLVANIDAAGAASSTGSDILTLCDHATGTTAQPTCASSDSGVVATIDALRAAVPTTDVEYGANLDEASLGLTDTTYAAVSGDGKWIAFGEGHKAPYARTFLLQDDGTVPGSYSYASPSLNIFDLINNASDQVFGVALDKFGKTLGVHGRETYFASVSVPFSQRLQGKKTTFNDGAGIAFHPNADGTATPNANDRLAFVASNNGSIELVDIAYYDFNRGTLATKFNLYGPLRASLPFATDPPTVVLKLFGLSPRGLVVIDVTATDIKPYP